MDIMFKSRERDSNISATNVSNHETVGKNGLKESKVVTNSENTASVGQNGVTKKANNIKLFSVFYQNIRGLRGKANELLSRLHPAFPHILCFTEHHMNLLELQQSNIDSYKLGANYCRTSYEKGGVCIYLHKGLKFVNIDLKNIAKIKILRYML
jgi:hypothetical protein